MQKESCNLVRGHD